MMKKISSYMNEYVIYGGIPTRRWKVIKHLESIGASNAPMQSTVGQDPVDITELKGNLGIQTNQEFDEWSDKILYKEG
jgi:hypothetical protein